MRAHEFYFCGAVLVVDRSCMLFLGSLQFMFVVWEGMVVVVFMDSLKAKLNICLYWWAHSLPLCFPVYICYVCMFSMSYTHTVCVYMLSPSVMSNSLQPHGLQPPRFFSPWDFLGKNTRVGCHFLLQRIFPAQGLNPRFHVSCTAGRIFTSETPRKPVCVCVCVYIYICFFFFFLVSILLWLLDWKATLKRI